MSSTVWSGRWVADRLGVELTGSPDLPGLLGLALRENPKRAHLLVSQVLGKHVPQRPAEVYGAGLRLGALVAELLGPRAAARAVVLGYAETATGLGHCVADALGAPYLHSTRRPVAGAPAAAGFEEEHSHATGHLLLPSDPELLSADGPLVLVDDELSTGRTVLNTIAALHRQHPREEYVIASLVDLRGEEDRELLAATAAALGTRVRAVALAEGRVHLPAGTLERARRLVEAAAVPAAAAETGGSVGGASGGGESVGGASVVDGSSGGGSSGDAASVEASSADASSVRAVLDWPEGLPDGGRHGFTPAHRAELESALPALGGALAEAVGTGRRRVLVLGFEELMYTPLRLAGALAERLGEDADVRFSTTTRSPVLAVDDPGYAIRTKLAFPAHDDPADGPGERYAYNVASGADPARRFDAIVLVIDAPADTPALRTLTGLLRAQTDRVVVAVVPSHRPIHSLGRNPASEPNV